MDSDLRATIVAACQEHEKNMWLDDNWRACVSIGERYFVKFGSVGNIESECATQNYLFNYAQRCHLKDTPRIAEILYHFIDESDCTMYLVMEYIKLQESLAPDFDDRIHRALLWLSKVPLPPNQWLGPVGGGPIRHKFFKDYEAPFPMSDLATLDQYIQRVCQYWIDQMIARSLISDWSRRTTGSR